MKKSLFCALAISMVIVSCRQGGEGETGAFATRQLESKRSFVVIGSAPFGPAGNVIGVENSIQMVWPEAGVLVPEAEAEMIARCFGDTVSTTVEEAMERMLYCTWGYEEDQPEMQMLELKSDSIADTLQYTYGHLESSCEVAGGVATFVIKDEVSVAGAAHGTYSAQYVNVDVASGTIIHIEDLMDTVQLGEALRMAVSGLEINGEVEGCLFDEFLAADRLPVPVDFFMDSTFSTITVVYQLYEVAPYACGIQSVVMPVEWLARRVDFTPRGKELFGLKAQDVAESR